MSEMQVFEGNFEQNLLTLRWSMDFVLCSYWMQRTM